MKRFWIAGMAVVILSTAHIVRAAEKGEHTYKITAENPLFTVMPELRTAPAPKWVKPGLRLSWFGASASIPMSYHSGLRQDPNGKLVDPATGKSLSLDDAASASGAGYTQIQILAVHDDAVIVSTATYGIEGTNGPVRTMTPGGAVTYPGACGDWWMNPVVLNKQAEVNNPDFRVLRTPYTAAGKKFNTLWVGVSSPNSSSGTVTDLDTGIVLHISTASASTGTTAVINGVPTSLGGQTDLGQSTFVGMREMKSPWSTARLPDLLRGVRRLTYTGTYRVVIPGSDVQVPPWQTTIVTDITGSGGDFIQGTRHIRVNPGSGVPPQDSNQDFVSGCNELMPTAIPPESLRTLQQGQTLDRDPVTKITTGVTFTGRDRQGRDIVVITESAGPNALTASAAYDRVSGICVGLSMVDPILHTDTEVSLVRKE